MLKKVCGALRHKWAFRKSQGALIWSKGALTVPRSALTIPGSAHIALENAHKGQALTMCRNCSQVDREQGSAHKMPKSSDKVPGSAHNVQELLTR